jgi:hypothetical protein
MTAILIVGDDPILLETRAHPLQDWQVSTTTSKGSVEAIRAKFYDLIIFCGRAIGLNASIDPQTASAFALSPRAILMRIRNRGSL